jgi:hypothetical protein
VAEQVEFGVVAVAEPAVDKRGLDARGQVAERVHAHVSATAQHGAGQPRIGELRAVDDADCDAGCGRSLERGRQRLDLFRRHLFTQITSRGVRSPAKKVDDVGAGYPKRQADHAVFAGAAAGAHGGQSRDGGRRETDLKRPAT